MGKNYCFLSESERAHFNLSEYITDLFLIFFWFVLLKIKFENLLKNMDFAALMDYLIILHQNNFTFLF